MNKVKVVTYCTYSSLGSILQAYGLKHQLQILDYESSILMYKSENQFKTQKMNSIKSIIKSLFHKIIAKKVKLGYTKRMNFINNYMNIEYCDNYNDVLMKSKNDNCETYISGSDQVWQPDNCNALFFLDFVEGKKCISYAASMGKTSIRDDKEELFNKYISNFNTISVREDECVDVIRKYTDKDIEVHIDPTFLVSADKWRERSLPYKIDEPYILLYMLYWDESCKEKIKQLKKKTGLKVYAIADGLSKVYADKFLYDVGVEEFLWLVDHAEYVVTSSFHGCAFSTIFNKKFSAVVNPKAPSRIDNLLRKLEVANVDIGLLSTTDAFDYEKTNQLIEFERNRSIEYLRRELD